MKRNLLFYVFNIIAIVLCTLIVISPYYAIFSEKTNTYDGLIIGLVIEGIIMIIIHVIYYIFIYVLKKNIILEDEISICKLYIFFSLIFMFTFPLTKNFFTNYIDKQTYFKENYCDVICDEDSRISFNHCICSNGKRIKIGK